MVLLKKEGHKMPALGFSLFLIAVGAILAFAVNVSVSGMSLHTVGIILLLVGVLGALMSSLFWTSFAPFAQRNDEATRTPTNTVVTTTTKE
jgi:Domain of unknown function (DUF6458)